jgi:hypothetical protein
MPNSVPLGKLQRIPGSSYQLSVLVHDGIVSCKVEEIGGSLTIRIGNGLHRICESYGPACSVAREFLFQIMLPAPLWYLPAIAVREMVSTTGEGGKENLTWPSSAEVP